MHFARYSYFFFQNERLNRFRGYGCLAYIDFERSSTAILLCRAQVLNISCTKKKNRLSLENCMLYYFPRADVTHEAHFGILFNFPTLVWKLSTGQVDQWLYAWPRLKVGSNWLRYFPNSLSHTSIQFVLELHPTYSYFSFLENSDSAITLTLFRLGYFKWQLKGRDPENSAAVLKLFRCLSGSSRNKKKCFKRHCDEQRTFQPLFKALLSSFQYKNSIFFSGLQWERQNNKIVLHLILMPSLCSDESKSQIMTFP